MYNQWSIKYIYKYIGLLSVLFPTNLGLGAGALSTGEKSDKTRKLGKIHILLQIKSEDIHSYMISII